jgi:tetrahydromethanopterin S-methyltransferase subunit G
MSFYIRKSVKFGPIRFNISKSGIGVSTGVKGARIATGPSGTYIHLGRNGVYYRQKIDLSVTSNESTTPKTSNASNNSNFVNAENINIDSTNKDTVAQINSRIGQPAFAWIIGILSTLLAGLILIFVLTVLNSISSFLNNALPFLIALSFIVTVGIWLLGIWIAWVTNQQEKLSRTTTLQYTLDDESKNKFADVQSAFELIAKSASLWRVISRTPTWDWKRNAGATSLIDRRRIRAGYMQPPFIQTRIKVYGISLESIQLFFFPDQVLVYQNGKYGAINYPSLSVSVSPTRFIEQDSVPHDSSVVDSTWRYVRKDGGPDGRFSNNRQIPIVQYGYIEFASQAGINLHFHISNLAYAQQFANTLSSYIRYLQTPNANSSSKESSRKSDNHSQAKKDEGKSSLPKEENAYTILNVPNNASWEEISTAYKKMAQMYHPDKVAGLAPEYREIAEKRMKIINAAYGQLKRNHGK